MRTHTESYVSRVQPIVSCISYLVRVQEGYAPIHYAAKEASLECVDALLPVGSVKKANFSLS